MRRVELGLLAALLLISAVIAARMQVSTDLLEALPQDGALGQAYADAARFALLDTVLVDVDGTGDPAGLGAAVDALGARLAEHPELWEVRYRVDLADGAALRTAALPYLISLIPADTLRARTSPEGIAQTLGAAQARLASPAGSLTARLLPRDPLDLATAFTDAAQRLAGGSGVRLSGGHFLDAAGTHALILLRTHGNSFGTTKADPLYTTLETTLASAALPARWVGAPRYAAEARETIQGETQRAVTAGVLLVATIFLVFFRSVRPLLGTLPAMLMGALCAGAMASLRSPIHGLALAFGGALAGLGVDYWIHLYLHGIKDGVPDTWQARLATARDALSHLMGAYRISVAATVTSFAALATSSYPAVADLGWIGIGCALGAFCGVVWGGPWLFAALARPGDRVPALAAMDRSPQWLILPTVVLLLGLAGAAIGLDFDGDPRAMDARTPATEALRTEIEGRWGGGGTAALVVAHGGDLDAALERLNPAVEALRDGAPGVSVQSPLTLLPPPSQRAERAAVVADRARIEADFVRTAEAAGFRSAGLVPGLRTTLDAVAPPTPATWAGTVVADLLGRTVAADAEGAHVAAVLRASTTAALSHAAYEVALSGAEVSVVNPVALAEEGAERIRTELLTRSGAGLLLVIAYLAFRFRDPVRVLAAAVPSLAAVVGTLGTLSWFGVALTPASGPALVLVLGLAFDQGIFLVEGEDGGRSRFLAARAAIVVALLNAAAGFLGLLTASHPAVHSVGLVVSLGILYTALGAFILTPALLTPSGNAAARRWLRRGAVAVVALLVVDQLVGWAGRIPPPAVTLDRSTTVEILSPHERRFGPNHLTRSHGIWVARLTGTPTQIGQANAELATEVRARTEAALYQTFNEKVPNRLVQYGLLRGLPFLGGAIGRHSPPAYLEEIAAYTQIGDDPWSWLVPAYTRKLVMHALHDVGQAMVDTPLLGCTGFLAGGDWTADGHWILARNWDFDGGTPFSEDKAVIAVHRDGAIPYLHVSILGLAGAVSGVNEAGIGIALQAAAADAPIRPGAPMIFIARRILENARSLDDVERILNEDNGFVSEAVLAVDGDAGEAAVFEVTPDDVTRMPAGTHLAQSNHLRGPHQDDAMNRSRMEHGTTVQRLDRMQALLDAGPVDLSRAIRMLRDRGDFPDGDPRAINADIASHGVVIDATARSLTVGDWPAVSGSFVTFTLEDVLADRMDGVVAAPPDDPERALRSIAAQR